MEKGKHAMLGKHLEKYLFSETVSTIPLCPTEDKDGNTHTAPKCKQLCYGPGLTPCPFIYLYFLISNIY